MNMKYVFRTVVFHFICILFFGYLYSTLEFDTIKGDPLDLMDYFFLSTTIQSGVGYTLVTPLTHMSKLAIMIQQFCMLSTNVFLLYVLIA
jgi:hypothetical protein